MKKSIVLIILAAALVATANASTTLATDPNETQGLTVLKFSAPQNVSMTVATTTTSSSLSGTAGQISLFVDGNRVVFVGEDTETDGVEIVRFTIEAHSADTIIDTLPIVAPWMTTGGALSYTMHTLRLGYDDEIVESQSLSLSSTPEPARTSFLALGLCAFALRRRRR